MVVTIPLFLLGYLTKNNFTKPSQGQSGGFFFRELLKESRNCFTDRPAILGGEQEEGKARIPSLFVLPQQISSINNKLAQLAQFHQRNFFFQYYTLFQGRFIPSFTSLSTSFFISNLTIWILYRHSDSHFRFSCMSLGNNLTLLG